MRLGMVAEVRRGERGMRRGFRRARAAHAFEHAAEVREGVTQPPEYYADHWFDHSAPPKAFLDREQARRDSWYQSARGRRQPVKPPLPVDHAQGWSPFAVGESGPVANLQRRLKVDRIGLACRLGLPLKYLAEVVRGENSTHRLRAAALQKLGLDIDALS